VTGVDGNGTEDSGTEDSGTGNRDHSEDNRGDASDDASVDTGTSPQAVAVPRQRRPASRARSAARVTARSVVALLSAAALLVTGYAYSAVDTVQETVRTTDALQVHHDEEPPPPENDGATDILLVGSDARTDMQGDPLPPEMLRTLRTEDKAGVNTDTLIVLRIPHDGSTPTGVSIPRDTWVEVPGRGKAKINSAYGVAKAEEAARLRAEGGFDRAEIERESDQAGRRVLVKTIQSFTQVRIDHYAEVNLLGFYLLTEALGGVEVCLNHATQDKDSGADFAAGPQTVSGGEALSFVRQRKNLPRGDLDRIVRQQAFLASALHDVLSAGTLTDQDLLRELTDAVHRSLVLDPDFDLLEFAEQAKGIATGDISFVTIPVTAVGTRSPDGQSIVEVDLAEVREFIAGLAGQGETTQAPPSGGGGAAPSGPAPAQITTDGVACVN
jgi:LCP family protein required for cell wall assembly